MLGQLASQSRAPPHFQMEPLEGAELARRRVAGESGPRSAGNIQTSAARQQQASSSRRDSSLDSSSEYKLPSWFNYNAYKRLYGKEYGSRFGNELHKRIYLKTALKVFEQRALYRLGRVDSRASVSELSDLVSDQVAVSSPS